MSHSHLGTRRAGMAVYSEDEGFDKAIHNIENAPFRTKFTCVNFLINFIYKITTIETRLYLLKIK